jgi:hypothetical protein
MRFDGNRRRALVPGIVAPAIAALAIAALAIVALARSGAPARSGALPAIVFVSRLPLPDAAAGAIPGLGPRQRASAPGGRLLIRDPNGAVRELLPRGSLWDVSDPSISPDARRVAFAGTPAPDSAWRIYVAGIDGQGLRAATRSDRALELAALGDEAGRFARYDDLDPCWVSDRALVFASTRFPQRAQYADLPVTNLFIVEVAGGTPRRLTSERNGAEEPSFDGARGRVLFARWWFNRWRASDRTPSGISADPDLAIPADTANVWQAMEMSPDGAGARVAAGWFRTRRDAMAYQPIALADGTVIGVMAANTGLSPAPGRLGLQSFARRFEKPRRIAGAALDSGGGYGGTGGLAAPGACSPAALPDGRIVFAFDPGARGDFGLWVAGARGEGPAPVVDLPGTLELDPAPVVPWPATWRARASSAARAPLPLPALPATRIETLRQPAATFRFLNLDVFSSAPAPGDSASVPRTRDARIRFFATLARPEAGGGDTAVLLREERVSPSGAVDVRGLPAGTPMFEQLTDSAGRVLRSAHAPAHVAGLNAGRAGDTARCVGCHLGHSTLPAPR